MFDLYLPLFGCLDVIVEVDDRIVGAVNNEHSRVVTFVTREHSSGLLFPVLDWLVQAAIGARAIPIGTRDLVSSEAT